MCPLHSSGGNGSTHHSSGPSSAGPVPPSRSRLAAVFTSAQQQQQDQQQQRHNRPHLRSPPSPPSHRDHRDVAGGPSGRHHGPTGPGNRVHPPLPDFPSSISAHRSALSARMQQNLQAQANGRSQPQPPPNEQRGNDHPPRLGDFFSSDPRQPPEKSRGREGSRRPPERSATQMLTQHLQQSIREQRVSNTNTPWSKGNQKRTVARGLRADEADEVWDDERDERDGRREEAEESEDEEVTEDHFQREKDGRAKREQQYAERGPRGGRGYNLNAGQDDMSDAEGGEDGRQQHAAPYRGRATALPVQRKRRRAPANNYGPVSRDTDSGSGSEEEQREVRRRGPAPSFPMSASRPPASAAARFRSNPRKDPDVDMERDGSDRDPSEGGSGSEEGRSHAQQPSAPPHQSSQHPHQRFPLPSMPHAPSEPGQQRQRHPTDAEQHFLLGDDSRDALRPTSAGALPDNVSELFPAEKQLAAPSSEGGFATWNAGQDTSEPLPADTAPRSAIVQLLAINASGQYIRTRPMGNGNRETSTEHSDRPPQPPSYTALDLNLNPLAQRPSPGPLAGKQQQQQAGGGSNVGVGLSLQRHAGGDVQTSTGAAGSPQRSFGAPFHHTTNAHGAQPNSR